MFLLDGLVIAAKNADIIKGACVFIRSLGVRMAFEQFEGELYMAEGLLVSEWKCSHFSREE